MSKPVNKLEEACNQVTDLGARAGAWIASDAAGLGLERAALAQQMQSLQQRARALAAAAGKRPCVGVAGSSRSGKTHLITGLAGRGPFSLSVALSGHDGAVDYLKQIRFEGPAVSGVMTRFTSEQSAAPAKFPVEVDLLSQAEIVKVLSASYLSGEATGEVVAPSQKLIETLSMKAGKHLSLFPIAGLSEQDVRSIQAHLEAMFAGSAPMRALSAGGFWDYFAASAPMMPQQGRRELLALLWGGRDDYTKLYDEIVVALEKLGHEPKAYCALSALADVNPANGAIAPIRDSILNTTALARIGKDEDDTILVRSHHGHWAAIPRGVLAALVAEVQIRLNDTDSDLLEFADIMEFPGLPPQQDVIRAHHGADERRQGIANLFARYKARLLISRACNALDVTSLVVCVDPDGDDVGGLAGIVSDWAERVHGATAVEREQLDCGLFVVLTKLDKMVSGSGDARIVTHDWSGRLDRALAAGIGHGARWAGEWRPGRAFDNVFLLRSPHHFAPELCDYLGNGMELCIKSSRAKDVADARNAFLGNDAVARHVADPLVVWQEALEPGDGGVTYLAQSIAETCHVLEKRRQINAELARLRHAMIERLQRFHVSDDIYEQRDLRRRAAHQVVNALRHGAEHNRFGRLLRAMHVPEGDLGNLFYALETNPYHAKLPVGRAGQVSLSESLMKLAVEADEAAATASAAGAQGAGAAGDRGDTAIKQAAGRYAEKAVVFWQSELHAMAGADHILRDLQLPRQAAASLVDEMIAGALRCNLPGIMRRRIEQGCAHLTNIEQRCAKAAIIAADTIGSFVNRLGFEVGWAEDHPRRKGRAQMIIFPPRQETGLASIGDVRTRLGKAFFADWAQAYMAMVDASAEHHQNLRSSEDVDPQLSELLRDLSLLDYRPVFRSAS